MFVQYEVKGNKLKELLVQLQLGQAPSTTYTNTTDAHMRAAEVDRGDLDHTVLLKWTR